MGVTDRAAALNDVMRRIERVKSGGFVELQTWKRDRSLLIVRDGHDSVTVHERGFVKTCHRVDSKGLKKLLKVLLKREFPRSRKVRIRTGGND
jgi:hypothetical protein